MAADMADSQRSFLFFKRNSTNLRIREIVASIQLPIRVSSKMISSKVKYSPPCRGDNRKSIIARGSGICQNIEKAAKADLLEVNNKSAFFIYNLKYQNREEDSP